MYSTSYQFSLKKLEVKRHVFVEPYLRNSRSVYMHLLDELIKKMPPYIDLQAQPILDQINLQKSLASRYLGGGGGWRRAKKKLVTAIGLGRRGKNDKDIASSDTASPHDMPPLYVFALLEGNCFNRELRQTIMTLHRFRGWAASSERLNDVLECLEAMHHGLIPFNFATHQHKRLYHIPLTIDHFINGWASHYWDIDKWLTNGFPTSGVDVGTLQNPRGLLHALRENCAFRNKKNLENIYLHAQIIDSPNLEVEEDCITLTGLVLHNATWNTHNRCIQRSSYITDNSRHPCVKVTASLMPQNIDEEQQYICPLYACSSAYTCIAQPHSKWGESRQDSRDEEFLINVPVHVKKQPILDRGTQSTSTILTEADDSNDKEIDDCEDNVEITPALFAERNCALHAGWRS